MGGCDSSSQKGISPKGLGWGQRLALVGRHTAGRGENSSRQRLDMFSKHGGDLIFYQKPGMGRQGPWNVSTRKMQGKVQVFLSSQYVPVTAEATAGTAFKPYSTCEESIFITIWQVRKRGPESRAPKHFHQRVLHYLFSFISHHLLPVLMSETHLETQSVFSLLCLCPGCDC